MQIKILHLYYDLLNLYGEYGNINILVAHLKDQGEEVELDKQQRINLPKELLKFAGINSQVTILGALDHIEFWDPETYDAYINDCPESYEIVAAKVMVENSNSL